MDNASLHPEPQNGMVIGDGSLVQNDVLTRRETLIIDTQEEGLVTMDMDTRLMWSQERVLGKTKS